ncbi:hypothetical protein [Euzebya sp.]|uniref:hypothetical protein n=1 Tax=Euzebya sp. TaxID=1971409 RepID=UPI0035152821
MGADDDAVAAALDVARDVLRAGGPAELPPRPWQHPGQPVPDGDLVRLAAWRSRDPDVPADVVAAGLALLGPARAELDQVEAALLFAARGAAMTWRQIAESLGLDSPQAAQQRMARVSGRLGGSPVEPAP